MVRFGWFRTIKKEGVVPSKKKKKGMVPGCLIWSRVRKQTGKMVPDWLVFGSGSGISVGVGFWFWVGAVRRGCIKKYVGVPLGPLGSGPVGSFRGSGVGGFDITLEPLASVEKCREQMVSVIRLLCSPYSSGRLRLSVSGFFRETKKCVSFGGADGGCKSG